MLVKDLFIVVDMENGNTVSVRDVDLELPVATAEEVRASRDKLLEDIVDKIPGSAVRWNLMSEEEQLAWTDYRQALLDVPEQEGFPTNVIWPTSP